MSHPGRTKTSLSITTANREVAARSPMLRLGLVQEVGFEDEPSAVSETAQPVMTGPIRRPSDHHDEVVRLGRLRDQSVQALGQAREPVPNVDDYRAPLHHVLNYYSMRMGAGAGRFL